RALLVGADGGGDARGVRGGGAVTSAPVRDRVSRLLGGRGWAVWPTLMSIAASGTAAATTLVIAWGIGAAAFGRFTLVLTIALIVTVGMLLNLNYVMYQELPRAEPQDRPALVTTALFTTLALGGGLVVIGLAASPLLTRLLGIDVRTLALALALALSMTANLLTESFLRGLKKFAFVAGLKLAVAAVHLVTAACFLLLAGIRDADVYLVALIVTHLLFALVSAAGFAVVPRLVSASLARSLLRHGAYMSVIAAFTAVLFGVDVIFLNHWATGSDAGVYSVYNGFPKRLLGVVFTE